MDGVEHPGVLLMVRIRSGLAFDEAERRYRGRMPEFRALPGLLQKYYLRDSGNKDLMGVYLFDNEASMKRYLASDLRGSIASVYEGVEAPRVEIAEVVDVLRPERP